jgi:hypothetical protein
MIKLTCNGVDKTDQVEWSSVEKNEVLTKEPDTLRFRIKNYDAKVWKPVLDDDIKLYDTDGTTVIFGGVVIDIRDSTNALLRYVDVLCKDYTHTLDRKLVSVSYANVSAASVISSIITDFTTGFTTTNVVAPTIVNKVVFNYLTVSKALTKLAETLGNYDWYVDYNKDINFFENGTRYAPFNLDDTSGNHVWNSLEVKQNTSQLRNKIIIRGGDAIGTAFTDYKIADGIQNTFFVGYNLSTYYFYKKLATPATQTTTITNATPAIFTATAHGLSTGTIITLTTTGGLPSGLSIATDYWVTVIDANTFKVSTSTENLLAGIFVNTTTAGSGTHTISKGYIILTVGADGKDDPTAFDTLYNPNTGLIRFQNSNTPALNSTIRWYGIPIYPLVSEKSDLSSISLYGEYQYVIVDTSIKSKIAASQRSDAELFKYAAPLKTGSFVTETAGLKTGQVISITSTQRGISDTYLINRITVKMRSPTTFIYQVEITNTVNGLSILNLLSSILSNRQADQISIDANEVVNRLYAANEDITFTESLVISKTHNPTPETVSLAETTYLQPLDYLTVFVAGPYVPTVSVNGADKKRQFVLDGSLLG